MKKILLLLLASIVLVACGGNKDESIKLKIQDVTFEDGVVHVIGETDLLDGAIISYSLSGTEGYTEVEGKEFKFNESIDKLKESDLFNVYDEGEINVWVSFMLLTATLDNPPQPNVVYEKYGEGGKYIKSADNVEEFEDGEMKRVVDEIHVSY